MCINLVCLGLLPVCSRLGSVSGPWRFSDVKSSNSLIQHPHWLAVSSELSDLVKFVLCFSLFALPRFWVQMSCMGI